MNGAIKLKMQKECLVILNIFLLSILTGCASLSPIPSPMPGWYSSVDELFVDLSAFPEHWGVKNDGDSDVRVNHIMREWSNYPFGGGRIYQNIWRVYDITGAKEEFSKMAKALTQGPSLVRIPSTSFRLPKEISYQSQVADIWSISCGYDGSGECIFAARYRNYVTSLYIDLELRESKNGLNYFEIDKLLKEVDSQFVKHLGFPEKASGIPPYLFSTPVPIKTDIYANILNQLLIKPDILPPSWKIVLSDLEDVTRIESGAYLSGRNFTRDRCYTSSTELNICYVTQFVFWYPSKKKANDEWERNYSQLDIGEPSDFGVWRIPDDINIPDMRADQAFIRCATFAGGEECQVYIRYESYLIVIIAEMQSAHTLMGHDRNGITHDEFLLLIEEVDKNSTSVLGTK